MSEREGIGRGHHEKEQPFYAGQGRILEMIAASAPLADILTRIVLDVWMPDMNGLEVQACLRRDSPKTRIIFITGREDSSVRQTALDAGAIGFLAKPFEDEALLQLIRKAVTR